MTTEQEMLRDQNVSTGGLGLPHGLGRLGCRFRKPAPGTFKVKARLADG
jgi:hypothetical protein